MPNDWRSFFGYSAWTFQKKTQQAYFHVFAPQQPDLNWKNPELRAEIFKMIRWWLELGIDGFRLDAISHIQKEPWDFKIKSMTGNGPWQPFMNVEGIEDYMRMLKAIFDEYGAFTVGEASGVLSSEASDWTDATGYFDAIFELEHRVVRKDGSLSIYGYKKKMREWQKALEERGWNALYLENHDGPRAISLYGDGSFASAKALAVSYMLLRGTPFIYQGQEIGMSNFPFTDIAQTDSPEAKPAYDKLIADGVSKKEALSAVTLNSRDHSRTPMQWSAERNAGFSQATRTWMPVRPDYKKVNAENPVSGLTELYRQLISLRHDEMAISDGAIDFLFVQHPTLFAYRRNEFLVITNLGKKKAHVTFADTDYQPVLGSCPHPLTEKMVFAAWEYQIYKKSPTVAKAASL
jgi:alpha-glucosidase